MAPSDEGAVSGAAADWGRDDLRAKEKSSIQTDGAF